MHKSFRWVLLVLFTMGIIITGCGSITQEKVVQHLQSIQQDLKTYKSKAMMSVQTSATPQKYYIETWYQSPSFYRIALGNEKREISQVILRNEEGIFIINPPLKKSFRFNGEWAENQGHVYLYHVMIQQILQAKEKVFVRETGKVSFDMPMVPENPLVVRQKIILDEKSLYPQQVLLFDKTEHPVVTIQYEDFKPGVKFEKDDFSPEKVMSLAAQKETIPAMASKNQWVMIGPTYTPKGYEHKETFESEGAIVLRFVGSEDAFILKESRLVSDQQELESSDLFDLYGTPAIVTNGGNVRTMYWMQNGVSFSLTGSLPVNEMMKIAQSTMGQSGK